MPVIAKNIGPINNGCPRIWNKEKGNKQVRIKPRNQDKELYIRLGSRFLGA